MENTNTVSEKPTISPKQEALDHLSNAVGVIDCLFTLNSTGYIDSLFDSTLDTMLDIAMRSINEAYKLISSEEVPA
jgi:hypothetical protein